MATLMTLAAAPSPASPAAPKAGTAAKSAGATAQIPAVGTSKAGKSFTDVLGQTQKNGQVDDQDAQQDNTDTSLTAMLQGLGLSPALIMVMLALGQQGNDSSSGELAGVNPQSMKALQQLSGQSDLLHQLVGNKDFQQLLNKISNLLASMNVGNSTGTANLAAVVNSPAANGQPLTKTAAEAKAIMDQFITALSHNKDSLLFQQLVEDFQEVVTPVLAEESAASLTQSAKASNGKGAAPDLNAKSASYDPQAQKTGAVQAATILAAAPSKSADPTLKLQAVQDSKPTTPLEMLAAKTGTANPLTQAVADSAQGDQEQAPAADSSTSFNNLLAPTNMQQFVRNLQLASSQPTTVQSFVQDVSKFVLSNFKTDSLNGFSQATLTLSPANLGQVDVKLTMQNGQLAAQFSAQTMLGKEMLEGQLSQLRLSLQNQGLQVDKLEVTQNSGLQSSLFQDQRQQPFQQPSSQQFASPSRNTYRDSDGIEASFPAQMASMVQTRNLYRNGFDVTA